MFFGKDKNLVTRKKKQVMDTWECRDLGDASEFLRMRIKRKNGMIYIDQVDYLDKVLKRFNMENASVAITPLPAGWRPSENKEEPDPKCRALYQSIIGSLLYIMLGTRPDICYAVTKLAQFASNPSQEHLDKAKYICRYLAGTRNYALIYDGKSGKGLQGYTDSDWAADHIKRRSITGYFFKLANGIFSWTSHAQKTVALSSTEAEYMALSDCARQAMWLKTLLSELGIALTAIPICGDNQGSIFIGSNPVQECCTKHIDIRYHYVHECMENGNIELSFIEGAKNTADMFTKNLGHVKFLEFRNQLG